MKILLSPDKFKGSLSADQVCDALQAGIQRFDRSIEVLQHPLADGGEGTLEVLGASIDLETVYCEVNDPLFRPITASYQCSADSAYIEMAAASGLPLLEESERNCLHTTTYGTGELIADAIRKGKQHIYLFVGGSATNDAGIGMAQALGYRFLNDTGDEIKPVGGELVNLRKIKTDALKADLSQIRFTVVCDVKNPLYGEQGAAVMYGAQKGADENAIRLLDKGLRQFADVVAVDLNKEVAHIEGAGAAGGIAAGAVAFFDATIQPGIQTLMAITSYKEKLKGVDLIITGEGKLDCQTIQGKVIHGVDEVSGAFNIPYAIVCGVLHDEALVREKLQAVSIRQVMQPGMPVEKAMKDAALYVEQLGYDTVAAFVKQKA